MSEETTQGNSTELSLMSVPAQVHLVFPKCNSCGQGLLVKSQDKKPDYTNGKFPHVCNNCGAEFELDDMYPQPRYTFGNPQESDEQEERTE